MRILFLYDGKGNIEDGLAFLSQFNYAEDTYLKVLVNEKAFPTEAILISSLNEIETRVLKYFMNYDFEFNSGGFMRQSIQIANSQEWDLVVYNDVSIETEGIFKGVKFKLWESRKSEELAKYITKPLLLIRNGKSELDKVLLATSAEPAALGTVVRAAKLLANIKPRLTLLHVMSQVALTQPGLEQDLLDSAEPAIERQTREGKHFIMAVRTLRENGFKGEIAPKIRHGLVLDEVLAELTTQNNDLLIVGSHYQAGRSRWLEFLLEDMAAELIGATRKSVLIVG